MLDRMHGRRAWLGATGAADVVGRVELCSTGCTAAEHGSARPGRWRLWVGSSHARRDGGTLLGRTRSPASRGLRPFVAAGGMARPYTGGVSRRPHLPARLLPLAVVAMLLMVLAPLLSRALPSVPRPEAPPMAMRHAQHAHGGHAGHPAATPAPAADPHAVHGHSCDYCVLVARLLPWGGGCALCLPPLRAGPPAPAARSSLPLAVARWSAHAARGPPKRAHVC